MTKTDYFDFPYHIDGRGRTAETDEDDHIRDLIYQVLFTNPAFVRSHDFYGSPDHQRTWLATEVLGSGWPSNAGGRLVGSLIAGMASRRGGD